MKIKVLLLSLCMVFSANNIFAQIDIDNSSVSSDNASEERVTTNNVSAEPENFQKQVSYDDLIKAMKDGKNVNIINNNYWNTNEEKKEEYPKTQPMSLTLLLGGHFPLDEKGAKTGFGGGFRYKVNFLKYFAFATSAEYTSIGFLENHFATIKGHLLVQRDVPIDKSGFVPYIGVGPAFATSIDNTQTRLGYSVIAGFQYVWKYAVTGINLDYSSYDLFGGNNSQFDFSSFKVNLEIGVRF